MSPLAIALGFVVTWLIVAPLLTVGICYVLCRIFEVARPLRPMSGPID